MKIAAGRVEKLQDDIVFSMLLAREILSEKTFNLIFKEILQDSTIKEVYLKERNNG